MAAINNLEGNTPNASSGDGSRAATATGFVAPSTVTFTNQDGHPFETVTAGKGGSSDASGPSKAAVANHEGNPNG
jgi:hypothetical protein